jgi:hypothetical protein
MLKNSRNTPNFSWGIFKLSLRDDGACPSFFQSGNTPNYSWGIFMFSLRDDGACPSFCVHLVREKETRLATGAPPLRPKLNIPQLKLGVLSDWKRRQAPSSLVG